MPTRSLPDEEYRQTFVGESTGGEPSAIHKAALERALDLRKFEIELYWARAAYFWTFIAAALAGFVAIQAINSDSREFASVLLCNLGIAFSTAWVCANRGSKHWQENWEHHVDMLEDKIQGPLYKTILTRGHPRTWSERAVHALTGPSELSVSKINQLLSVYILAVWVGLLVHALPPFSLIGRIAWPYAFMSLGTGLLCIAFFTLGKTYKGGYWHKGTIRTSKIQAASPE